MRDLAARTVVVRGLVEPGFKSVQQSAPALLAQARLGTGHPA